MNLPYNLSNDFYKRRENETPTLFNKLRINFIHRKITAVETIMKFNKYKHIQEVQIHTPRQHRSHKLCACCFYFWTCWRVSVLCLSLCMAYWHPWVSSFRRSHRVLKNWQSCYRAGVGYYIVSPALNSYSKILSAKMLGKGGMGSQRQSLLEYDRWSYKADRGNMLVSSAMPRLCRKAQTTKWRLQPSPHVESAGALDWTLQPLNLRAT